MSIIVKGSGGGAGGEDLTVELANLGASITEIEESLVGKLTGANITPETVLAGYRGYKGKELVEGVYDVSNVIPENVREGVSFGVDMVGAMKEAPQYGIFYDKVNENGYPTSLVYRIPGGMPKNSLSTSANTNFFEYVTKVLIDIPSIPESFFTGQFRRLANNAKIKLKNVTSIGKNALSGIGEVVTSRGFKVFIPKTCTTITGDSYSNAPFYGANTKINLYCEATSKPDGFGYYWNHYNSSGTVAYVMWGVTESQFDAM